MNKVGRSIKRVNDPAVVVAVGRNGFGCRGFLADKLMIGEVVQQDLLDNFLGFDVGLGHEIAWAFLRYFGSPKPIHQTFAASLSGLLTNFEEMIEFFWGRFGNRHNWKSVGCLFRTTQGCRIVVAIVRYEGKRFQGDVEPYEILMGAISGGRMKPQHKWKLHDGVAQVDLQSLTLKVDTTAPELGGLVEFCPTGTETSSDSRRVDVDAALFQVRTLARDLKRATETYCRGRDLITRYRADETDPIDREIYWRLVDDADFDGNVTSVETIYSLQTDLLDCSPQPSTPSVFRSGSPQWYRVGVDANGEIEWHECGWDDACFASGEAEGRVACLLKSETGRSSLQTVFPADLRGIEISTTADQTEIHWHLRSEFLEKGVIRRLRMLTVLGGIESSDQELLDAASRFYTSDLPLTV